MQHTFGYARVSASGQNLDTQLNDLTRAGCARIFQEKVSGTRTKSLALDELLAAVREGDVVIVNRLARLGRNTVHTIQLVEEFNRRRVHFRALNLGIDSRTPAGKMINWCVLAKVAKVLDKSLSVAEIMTLTGISRASVRRYRHELASG